MLFGTLATACSAPTDPSIVAAVENVRSHEKDPSAAQFRNVSKCKHGVYVTGEVLGKNSFGAYVGWHRFWANEFEVIVDDDDERGKIEGAEDNCTKAEEQLEREGNAAALALNAQLEQGQRATGDAASQQSSVDDGDAGSGDDIVAPERDSTVASPSPKPETVQEAPYANDHGFDDDRRNQ